MSGNVITDLTPENIEEIKEVFELFDLNGDTTITVKELGMVMRALGHNPTEAEMRAIIAEIDADGNGIIEFPEFVDLMSRRPWGSQGSREELQEAFHGFDHDGSGYISASELRRMLTSQGEKLTDQELSEMLDQIPQDGDGKIPFSACVSMLMEYENQ